MRGPCRTVWPVFLCAFLPFIQAWGTYTALDAYVAQEDPSYGWTLGSAEPFLAGSGTLYTLNLTSQTWRSGAEVNRSVWQHVLNIAVPTNHVSDLALLIVEGGSNTSPPADVSEYAYFSSLLGCTVAFLQYVPNQPLRFYNPDTGSLSEDNAIGHTYDRYLDLYVEGQPHADPTWPLLLPMVKSAVRAMDAVQECLAQEEEMDLTRFIVGGASKRGWTTWLTGAVDSRVVGIVPVVIDILNMERQLRHHKNAYSSYPADSGTYYMTGGYSSAVSPYTSRQVFDRLDTPGGAALREIVDPYTYRDRLTMPKLIVNSTGDQFFLPDGIQFYFNQLPGKNYVYYVPNSDHGLGLDASSLDVIGILFNFVRSFYRNAPPLPEYAWSFERDGSIRVAPATAPSGAWLWQAHVSNHRDFRLRNVGEIWTQTPLTTTDETGAFIASVPVPESGWTGFYVQLDFEDGSSFCSGLRVLPETYANAADPPDIYGPRFTLTYLSDFLARTGDVLELAFSSSEPLHGLPDVQVNGAPALFLSQEGDAWRFAYTVQSSDADGAAVISCRGEDVYDNPGENMFPDALAFDQVPPQCLEFNASPAMARPGDLVTLAFSSSESLLSDPEVMVNGNPASRFPGKADSYTYQYVVSEFDEPGPASVEITLIDPAGNATHSVYPESVQFSGALPLRALPVAVALLLAALCFLPGNRKPRLNDGA